MNDEHYVNREGNLIIISMQRVHDANYVRNVVVPRRKRFHVHMLEDLQRVQNNGSHKQKE
jgi:hypothetical protein